MSLILFLETGIVGIISLILGLLVGFAASQGLSGARCVRQAYKTSSISPPSCVTTRMMRAKNDAVHVLYSHGGI